MTSVCDRGIVSIRFSSVLILAIFILTPCFASAQGSAQAMCDRHDAGSAIGGDTYDLGVTASSCEEAREILLEGCWDLLFKAALAVARQSVRCSQSRIVYQDPITKEWKKESCQVDHERFAPDNRACVNPRCSAVADVQEPGGQQSCRCTVAAIFHLAIDCNPAGDAVVMPDPPLPPSPCRYDPRGGGFLC